MEQLNEDLTYDRRLRPDRSGKQIAYRSLLLLILLLVLAALIYLYIFLTKPPQPVGGPPEVRGVSHDFSIYGYGPKEAQLLSKPHGVNVDKDGRIYVADTGNHRILVFDRRGKHLFKFGEEGREKGQMLFPLNVAIAPNGRVFVISFSQKKLMMFDVLGQQAKFIKEIEYELENAPIAVQVFEERVYLAARDGVSVLNLNGDNVQKWGSAGRNPGQFEYPNGIYLDKEGHVFVSDTNNDRIQIFDKDGVLAGIQGEPPTDMNDTDRLFGLGVGLVLDETENVYVVDSFHHAIRVFDHDGKDLGAFGAEGSDDGKFRYPSTIAYLGGKTFAVADQGNNRVQILSLSLESEKPRSLTQRVLKLSPAAQVGIVLGGLAAIVLILWPLRHLLMGLFRQRRRD